MAARAIARCGGLMLAVAMAACGEASAVGGTMSMANAPAAQGGNGAGPAAAGSFSSQAGSAGSVAENGSEVLGPATFTTLYTQVFTSCRRPICHGGGVAELDMTSQAAAHAGLVNRPVLATGVCAFTGLTRVVPFQPDQSLLIGKMEVKAPCGQQMPIGGLLSQEKRDLVRAWVLAGALDD